MIQTKNKLISRMQINSDTDWSYYKIIKFIKFKNKSLLHNTEVILDDFKCKKEDFQWKCFL